MSWPLSPQNTAHSPPRLPRVGAVVSQAERERAVGCHMAGNRWTKGRSSKEIWLWHWCSSRSYPLGIWRYGRPCLCPDGVRWRLEIPFDRISSDSRDASGLCTSGNGRTADDQLIHGRQQRLDHAHSYWRHSSEPDPGREPPEPISALATWQDRTGALGSSISPRSPRNAVTKIRRKLRVLALGRCALSGSPRTGGRAF
jgi:hypothetical protein